MLSVEIGTLTHSILDVATGRSLSTSVSSAKVAEVRRLKGKWNFDWKSEIDSFEVYKLVADEIGVEIQGLISLARMDDHVFVNLLESHPANVGRNKRFDGVPGNLMAFAARLSLSLGCGGVVAFDAKTELIEHYKQVFLAQQIGRSQRMVIEEAAAIALISKYYGD